MQGAKVLNLIALTFILIAVTADYALPRLAAPRPEALDVESFPRALGPWQAGADRPVDPEIAERLTTATVVERDYRNAETGQDIDLMLVTADQDQDIHDPALCLPAQGWDMSAPRALRLSRQAVNEVDIRRGGARYVVLYWLAGYQEPDRKAGTLLAPVLKVRKRLVGNHEGASLLVRIAARQEDRSVAESFASEIMPGIESLRRGRTGVTSSVSR